MLMMAELYQDDKTMQKTQDAIYGEETTEFIGRAIWAFYSLKDVNGTE